jgi:hypothetical protein
VMNVAMTGLVDETNDNSVFSLVVGDRAQTDATRVEQHM